MVLLLSQFYCEKPEVNNIARLTQRMVAESGFEPRQVCYHNKCKLFKFISKENTHESLFLKNELVLYKGKLFGIE